MSLKSRKKDLIKRPTLDWPVPRPEPCRRQLPNLRLLLTGQQPQISLGFCPINLLIPRKGRGQNGDWIPLAEAIAGQVVRLGELHKIARISLRFCCVAKRARRCRGRIYRCRTCCPFFGALVKVLVAPMAKAWVK